MQTLLLTSVVMVAFAANSLLNRAGVAGAGMDPVLFGILRLGAGAVCLALLARATRRVVTLRPSAGRAIGAGSLLLYIFGFSLAYRALDAGAGALILFGTVQVTMFAGALLAREALPARRWAGMALAFAGLAWLLWPGAGARLPLVESGFMVAAGIGWGLYSLAGRGAADPLAETAANFIWAAPLAALGLLAGVEGPVTGGGLALAVVSGAIASGLGYALWYAILPRLGASRAAVAQLSVPVIALAGGALLLGEVPAMRVMLAALVVLGGIALALGRPRQRQG